MRNAVTNIIELLIGALLIGISLLCLASQYRALSNLTDIVTVRTLADSNVFQQYNLITLDQLSDEELYAAIMGYREYPIMVDGNIIPITGHDYDDYISYIRDGIYNKEYQYDLKRNIIMIVFTKIGT
jgi:hypothetical protein